jgi:RND family efflux transporter MFP subunit
MKKKAALLAILLVLGLFGWQIYARLTSLDKSSMRRKGAIPVAVKAAPIRKVTLKDIGFFTGSLYPKSQFIVAPKIAGRLDKLFVKIGDRVKKDQLIAVLENEEYLQQVDQAKAELEVARANFQESRSSLEIADREFERAKTLRQKRIASESELDSAQAQFSAQDAKHKVAAAQVTQKEAALKAAQVRLAYTQIRTSWEDGDDTRVVGERFVDDGAMLAPNASIVSVLDIRTLTGVIYVIERDYSKVRIGQPAVVSTDAFPGKTFLGRVVRVAPILKETSREARVEIEVPNPDGVLKPGMFIRVEIEFSKVDEATVVPISAVAKRNGRQGVFQIDLKEMTAQFVPVDLGIVNNEQAQILNPPLTGQVVTLGHHLLEEGSSIILPGKGDDQGKAEENKRDGGMKR